MNKLDLIGRLVPKNVTEIIDLKDLPLVVQPAITINQVNIHCTRCDSNCEKSEAILQDQNYFCYKCLNLGRLDSSMQLIHLPGINQFEVIEPVLTWKGQLTDLQQSCSTEIVQAFQKQENKLLWAVTGAGKTEISFAGIAWALAQGLRVCIASPRVDVCVELFPRYKAAFANTSMILLHGKSEETYQYCQLTICTTHQLLKFKQAFDILIIDEVDAFPYANSHSLQMGAKRSVKQTGSRLLMTATPSLKLQKQYQISYLPLRFHRHLLPQIKLHFCFNWKRKIYAGQVSAKVVRKVLQKIEKKQRFLIFVPRIRDLQVFDEVLTKKYSGKKCWETVYSADEQRMEKVQAMRKEKILFLITTTILERGVTFPGIDVIIFGGDERVFSVASLVQIAGRVGRKASRPNGDVDCYIGNYTKNIALARKQIKEMNQRGKALG